MGGCGHWSNWRRCDRRSHLLCEERREEILKSLRSNDRGGLPCLEGVNECAEIESSDGCRRSAGEEICERRRGLNEWIKGDHLFLLEKCQAGERSKTRSHRREAERTAESGPKAGTSEEL